jgi:hypothetical protein
MNISRERRIDTNILARVRWDKPSISWIGWVRVGNGIDLLRRRQGTVVCSIVHIARKMRVRLFAPVGFDGLVELSKRWKTQVWDARERHGMMTHDCKRAVLDGT